MAVDIHKLIAAIAPDVYCENDEMDDPDNSGKKIKRVDLVKRIRNASLAKGEKDAYLKAAKFTKTKAIEGADFAHGDLKANSAGWTKGNPFKNVKTRFKAPCEKHVMLYDSFGEGLEPSYFWILDTVRNLGMGNVDKIIDNFVSSPGSGHFSEMGAKATRMQEEAMKMLGAANQVMKSLLNIIYDLKEFEIRLSLYDLLKSEENDKKNAAMLSLKQVWLDTVDAKRGNTSVKAMALTQAGFVTLIDAFMAVEDEKLTFQGKEIDLNDRVKRILKQKILEYNLWLKQSEMELRKRFEIEKIYLKSQYNTLQLYARWAKPYLKAARQLEQNAKESFDLVTMFSTTILELSILARGSYDPNDDVNTGDLPKIFKDSNKKAFSPTLAIELRFRSYPEKFGQNYGFRGKVDIVFTSYCLAEEEVNILKDQIDRDNFSDIFSLIEGATSESLAVIQPDLDKFLLDKKPEEKTEKKKQESEEDLNPFSSLISFFSSEKKETKKTDKKTSSPSPDSEIDQVLRSQAIYIARQRCAKIYHLYKKVHGMPSYDLTSDIF